MIETIIISLAIALTGIGIGYFLGRRRKLSEGYMQMLMSNGQYLSYMYLAMDEMYRVKFNKWAQTDQGQRYVEAVSNNLGGYLFLLPLDDKEELEKIIHQLGD